jgi:Fur family iron response transcriptional regulator
MNSKQKHGEKKYLSSALLLQDAGLRPTRQRLALAEFLFDGYDKHVTAEQIHAVAVKKRMQVSLATVYNTLNNFTAAGLLRQVTIDGGQVYFDTNIGNHYHLFDEKTGHLTDIPACDVRISKLPKLPQGKSLSRIDVIVRMHSDA